MFADSNNGLTIRYHEPSGIIRILYHGQLTVLRPINKVPHGHVTARAEKVDTLSLIDPLGNLSLPIKQEPSCDDLCSIDSQSGLCRMHDKTRIGDYSDCNLPH